MLRKTLLTAVTGAALIFGSAQAAPVTGGSTVVEVTAPLIDLGATPGVIGTASTSTSDGGNLVVTFPITGGDLEGIVGTIEHEGSGASLTIDGTVVELRNLLIDTTVSSIFSDVYVDDGFVDTLEAFTFSVPADPDFMLTSPDDPMLELFVSSAVGLALEPLLGQNIAGATFGFASVGPETAPIPLPAAGLLFATGAVGIAASRRRKKAAA